MTCSVSSSTLSGWKSSWSCQIRWNYQYSSQQVPRKKMKMKISGNLPLPETCLPAADCRSMYKRDWENLSSNAALYKYSLAWPLPASNRHWLQVDPTTNLSNRSRSDWCDPINCYIPLESLAPGVHSLLITQPNSSHKTTQQDADLEEELSAAEWRSLCRQTKVHRSSRYSILGPQSCNLKILIYSLGHTSRRSLTVCEKPILRLPSFYISVEAGDFLREWLHANQTLFLWTNV